MRSIKEITDKEGQMIEVGYSQDNGISTTIATEMFDCPLDACDWLEEASLCGNIEILEIVVIEKVNYER
jgi:hypothetical protein